MSATAPHESRHERPVLDFDNCVLALGGTDGDSFTVGLSLHPGDLVLLHCQDDQHEDALTRAISGLLPPLSGDLRYCERDWRELPPDQANALRGRIGVAFREDCWVPYRSVLDNLMLAQLHHTRREAGAIRAEATRWALRFGLPGAPDDRPADVGASDRQRASLARAFIGDPAAIVIEHQSPRLSARLHAALVGAVLDARDRGALVIWCSRELRFVLDETMPATRRLRLGDGTLRPLEGPA